MNQERFELATHKNFLLLKRLVDASDWAKNLTSNHPELYLKNFLNGAWDSPFSEHTLDKARLTNDLALDRYMKNIREIRNNALLHIAYRDINQLDSLIDINRALTLLAEILCQAALNYSYVQRALTHLIPYDSAGEPIHPYVIGMGKTGGFELNFSSDIDLIIGFKDNGENAADADFDGANFFHKVALQFIAILHQPMTEGFVYRVDLRLRPYGESGPLAMSTKALTNYYHQYGRDWERYALIKARPIAGAIEEGHVFLAGVNTFIYRQYIDYSMVDALRTIKKMIQAEVAKKNIEQDIKLGAGGIREVEFIVQSFQLIYGGHDKNLQSTELISTLEYLGECNRLPKGMVAQLTEAYLFLRAIENRLQLVNDEQTHNLPTTQTEQARLACSMNFNNWEAFNSELTQHRSLINAQFMGVFGALSYKDNDKKLMTFVSMFSKPQEHSVFMAWLENENIEDGEQKAYLLWSFQKNIYLKQEKNDQKRLAIIVLQALRHLGSATTSTQTLNLFLEVLGIISQKTPYLALLNEKSDALARLLNLCESSPWVSRYLAKYPILLDQLINVPESIKPLNQKILIRDLNVLLNQSPKPNEEGLLNTLRDFQHTHILQVAMADLSDQMPLMIVSDHLSEIAESLLNKILKMAWYDLSLKHGHPTSDKHNNGRPDFIIVAYGKLGGLELGYQSDLDIVFLHDSPGEDFQTDGAQKIPNTDFFIKLTQRIIYYLNAQTSAGHLYEVDTRLRPSGDSGLIVSSFESFKRYQMEEAWVWEHQALIRARAITGSQTLTNAFNQLRKEILAKKRETAPLKQAIIEMRARLYKQHHPLKTVAQKLKFGSGGMIDIEFLVQYLVLAHAVHEPLLIKFTDNIRQLAALEALGRISSWDAMILRDTYRNIRNIQHKMHLSENQEIILDDKLLEKINQTGNIYKKIFTVNP